MRIASTETMGGVLRRAAVRGQAAGGGATRAKHTDGLLEVHRGHVLAVGVACARVVKTQVWSEV